MFLLVFWERFLETSSANSERFQGLLLFFPHGTCPQRRPWVRTIHDLGTKIRSQGSIAILRFLRFFVQLKHSNLEMSNDIEIASPRDREQLIKITPEDGILGDGWTVVPRRLYRTKSMELGPIFHDSRG